MPPNIIFVTGTDTGVGKTLLTASLLLYWRAQGIDALAAKPLCSGGRGDVALLQAAQAGARLPDDLVNPFYFDAPLAPLLAARRQRRVVSLGSVLGRLRRLSRRCACLLVEGAGGLLSPLGPRFSARDIIARLRCRVVVVAPNQLGTLNHTLLTLRALPPLPHPPVIILMDTARPDPSNPSNPRLLRELLPDVPIHRLPHLGPNASHPKALPRHSRRFAPIFKSLSLNLLQNPNSEL